MKPACLVHLNQAVASLWKLALHGRLSHISKEKAVELYQAFFQKLAVSYQKILFSYAEDDECFNNHGINDNIEKISYDKDLALVRKLLPENQQLAFFGGVYPLFDPVLSGNLYEIHDKFGADYSFSENAPAGLCPVFMGATLLEALEMVDEEISRPLPDYVQGNLNKFHVEIHYEEPDLRMHRLDFSTGNYRSLVETASFFDKLDKDTPAFKELLPALEKDGTIIYSLPSYLEIELISDCEYKCDFCPRQFHDFEKFQLNSDDIEKVNQFVSNGFGDIAITLGGLGEPLQHPDAAGIMAKLLDNDKLQLLILETNGFYLERIEPLLKHRNLDRLRVIVNLNSLEAYEKLHGCPAENLQKVKDNLAKLVSSLNEVDQKLATNVYIQVLKIIENETEVDAIYDLAQQLGVSFLLQKYNRFIDLMPERRVSDMTPLTRSFCWHLRRDMFIRADGSVSFCKQDVAGSKTRGNIHSEPLENIWQGQGADFAANLQNKFPAGIDCQACDEYFTFNH